MSQSADQDVSEYGFTLYFLAFTAEDPPEEDLAHVGIREWLWQRPYTTLELQHTHSSAVADRGQQGEGFHMLQLKVGELEAAKKRLNSESDLVTGPDGVKVLLMS